MKNNFLSAVTTYVTFTIPTRLMEKEFPHQNQLWKLNCPSTNQIVAHAHKSPTGRLSWDIILKCTGTCIHVSISSFPLKGEYHTLWCLKVAEILQSTVHKLSTSQECGSLKMYSLVQ